MILIGLQIIFVNFSILNLSMTNHNHPSKSCTVTYQQKMCTKIFTHQYLLEVVVIWQE
jgi:hypothetical protein